MATNLRRLRLPRPSGAVMKTPATFTAGYGSRTLLKDRLAALADAFLADSRPGLIFEYGRLVFANEAAKAVLRSTQGADEFLNDLREAVSCAKPVALPVLGTESGTYAPVMHPGRSRQGHPTRICFLIRRSSPSPALSALSERELEVLGQLTHGLTNGQIAKRLGISIETVRKHVSSALEKTGTSTRTALAARALGR